MEENLPTLKRVTQLFLLPILLATLGASGGCSSNSRPHSEHSQLTHHIPQDFWVGKKPPGPNSPPSSDTKEITSTLDALLTIITLGIYPSSAVRNGAFSD